MLDALDGDELAASARPLGIATEGDVGALRDRVRAAVAGTTVKAARRAALAQIVGQIVVVPAKLVGIIDGDTIDVVAEGEKYRVRIRGIDAPESSLSDKAEADIDRGEVSTELMFAMGVAATDWLRSRLGARPLFLHVQPTPLGPKKYLHHNLYRLLAYVTVDAPDGEDVGEAMLREGYALVWPRGLKTRRYDHPWVEKYLSSCHAALTSKPGLWKRQLRVMCPSEAENTDWTTEDCARSCSPRSA
ncbi:MAG: thermonuclease family protein [Byssovorax sp.]